LAYGLIAPDGGSRARDGLVWRNTTQSSRVQAKCLICGKTGHIKKACRGKKQTRNQRNSVKVVEVEERRARFVYGIFTVPVELRNLLTNPWK